LSDEARASVVVVGVGNDALSDEGVAGRVVREVARRAPPWVEVVDAGLPGPRLVDLLDGRQKAVIVDAVDAGRPAGTVYRFRPDEARSAGAERACSLHQGNLLQHLELAEALGMGPGETVIVGVQPESLAPGHTLSPPVEDAVAAAAEVVLAEVGS
jgi:hydrogenase maturation protease